MATLSPCSPQPGDGDVGQDALPTHFAPAERSSPDQLRGELAYLDADPVVDAMMRAAAGLVAVLNEKRQVLALNTRMLEVLGFGDPGQLLGLRLGEAVGCVHGHEPPAGCGTTEYCSTCGAAIAQASSLALNHAVERTCAIDLKQPIKGSDQLYFRVQACPIQRGDRRILLVFLQDITEAQQRALLDRTFFHDVKNTLAAVLTAGQLIGMERGGPDAAVATMLVEMTKRLAREIELQRCLCNGTMERFERTQLRVPIGEVLDQLVQLTAQNPVAGQRRIDVAAVPEHAPVLRTDPTLLLRILQNMVINALEATSEARAIRVWVEATADAVEFCVWNEGAIPIDVARRVFQRNFSTKGEMGRGLGTYSMKLLGERMLGGKVSFTSTGAEGTVFRFRLPVAIA